MKKRIMLYKQTFSDTRGLIRSNGKFAKLFGFVKFIMFNKFAFPNFKVNSEESASDQFEYMLKHLKLNYSLDYVYPFDSSVIRCIRIGFHPIASVTIDANSVLYTSLNMKKEEVIASSLNDSFRKALLKTLGSIENLCNRISDDLLNVKNPRSILLSKFIHNIINSTASSFDEAIQRILFFNALFWQNRHMQNGIGRLDFVLYPFYQRDILDGSLTREKAKQLLASMFRVLGKDMLLKSAALIGDTGQVIILGGVDANGNNVDNELTRLILEIFTEQPMPDPKIVLRVNKNTSEGLWKKAISCILKGSGSPLIMNEDVIKPLMVSFGYDSEDVYNLGTSACWEPLIIGKSLDQNNCIKNICILDALTSTLENQGIQSYESFLQSFDLKIEECIRDLNLKIKFENSPLLSLFFDNCLEKEKDFSKGGAKYNHHGLLVVGLPNLINSILNIKKYVFDMGVCSLQDCLTCIENDYVGHEDLRILFSSGALKFGSNNSEVVNLTNHVMEQIGKAVSKRTMFGEKIKVGFSSPSYIGLAKGYPASLDGRHKGDPFAVHISPISSNIDISEILDFASSLKYEDNRINGNVVDFIVPASYTKNPDKLATILKAACKKGIFELQLNVLDKKTLIDAKAHPEKYPNLIVRVWGFSAYFNDLPEEYKDNLIQRAELYE